MKLLNRVLQSLALPSIVIFAASNLLFSEIASADAACPADVDAATCSARNQQCRAFIEERWRFCLAGDAQAYGMTASDAATVLRDTQRAGARSNIVGASHFTNTVTQGQLSTFVACGGTFQGAPGGVTQSASTFQQKCSTALAAGGCSDVDLPAVAATASAAAVPATNFQARCAEINGKRDIAGVNINFGTANMDVLNQGLAQATGEGDAAGAARGIHGWMSDNPLKTAAIAGVGAYLLGSSMGDNKEQKEIDKLKKELAAKSVAGGTDTSGDDCSKPGVITKQECATHFASLCYNNSSAASCAEFNVAYCNGGSSVSGAINGSGSFYCSMMGVKAQCANSSDTGMTCMWYRQLSQSCLTNLAQLQSATCMPQYAGNTYSMNCAATPSQKLCQAPFSTILSNSAQVAAQGTASGNSSGVTGEVSAQSAIGSASAGVNVGAATSSAISRGIASSDVSPMGANLFSNQDAALAGVNLVGSGQ